jgi:excisionase family DNA binding protein
LHALEPDLYHVAHGLASSKDEVVDNYQVLNFISVADDQQKLISSRFNKPGDGSPALTDAEVAALMNQSKKVEPEKLAVRVRTAAQMLDCSPATVYQLVREGKLPGIQLGDRGLRVPVSSVRALLAEPTPAAE